MTHDLRVLAGLWVFGLAIAGAILAVIVVVWHSRFERRRFAGWCDSLHVHPDLIHSHHDGDRAHLHTPTGERVFVGTSAAAGWE